MSAQVQIKRSGPFSTVQDLGRHGHLRFGVAECGAMDQERLVIANKLVGNVPTAAALEATFVGDCLQVLSGRCAIGLAGDGRVQLNGTNIEPWRSYQLRPGDILDVGPLRGSAYFYVAFSGGVLVPEFLGSRSTHVRSGLGGLGRKLIPGDVLEVGSTAEQGFSACFVEHPSACANAAIRIIPGPQLDYFGDDALAILVSAKWELSAQSDRMGYRLLGPRLSHKLGFNIVSDGLLAGSIQVPGSGAPIVLMRDHQTTGGYPKIATVISADLDRLARKLPREMILFQVVSFATARQALTDHLRTIDAVEPRRLGSAQAVDANFTGRLLGVNLIAGVISAFEDSHD